MRIYGENLTMNVHIKFVVILPRNFAGGVEEEKYSYVRSNFRFDLWDIIRLKHIIL